MSVEYMDMVSRIQLGFDIATSITIIGAAIGFIYESRRRSLGDSAAASAYDNLSKSLSALGNKFIHQIINLSQVFERNLDVIDIEMIKKGELDKEYVKNIRESLDKYRDVVGEFYETAHAEKFAICAVLDAFKGEKYVRRFVNELSDAGHAYNDLVKSNSVFDLIGEIVEFSKVGDDVDDKHERAMTLANSLVVYAPNVVMEQLLRTLTTTEQDDNQLVEKIMGACKDESGRDRLLKFIAAQEGSEVHARLYSFLYEKPEKVVLNLIKYISLLSMNARRECKEILIFLSAACSASIQKLSFDKFEILIKKFETEEYLDIDRSIR